MRNNPPGSIGETTRKAIEAHGGLQQASDDLGLSVPTLSKASGAEKDRPGGLGIKYLHMLGRITPASAEPVAIHFARLAGGVFQPLPDKGPLLSNINTLMREFSDVLDVHAKAHSERSEDPSDFTKPEARHALAETDELLYALLSYRAALEEKCK